MSNVAVFNFESKEIRSVFLNGDPFFVGKDVATALGYLDPTSAVKQHCRGVAKYHPMLDALNRMQETRVISEPDVLRLIVGSQLPAAQEFERWVFEDVLPSIRKTGKYAAPATFTNPATKELAHQLEVMSLFGVPLHLAQSEATKEVLLLCGVDYSKALKLAPAQQGMLTHEEMLEPTELGRIVGLSAAHMNQRLEAAGMQTKTVDGWALTGLGAPYATRHHWQSKNGIKSGYNMKWRRSVLKMLDL